MQNKVLAAFVPQRVIHLPAAISVGVFLSLALISVSLGANVSSDLPIDSHLQLLISPIENGGIEGSLVDPQAENDLPNGVRLAGVARYDQQGRVLVHIHLDGSQPMAAIEKALGSYNVQLLGRNERYKHGMMAAYVAASDIPVISKLPGILSITLEYAPITRASHTILDEGVYVLDTLGANNMGYTGSGVTVGVLSDSFNTARFNKRNPPATTASQDEANGYLPHVVVLEEGPKAATDEGRAMCQLVYACAPGCGEAFATADISEVDFANNIVKLRTDSSAHCNVIVDDVGYFDEPVFSDGMVAQAVDEAVTSTADPGTPVFYCSAAGNDGDNGYRSAYRELSDREVRTAERNVGNLKLDQVPKALTAGGWHNWSTARFEPSTTVTVPEIPADIQAFGLIKYTIFLQWDDPFHENNGVTDSYNLLVFDENGDFLKNLSSTTDAYKTQQPIQGAGLFKANKVYQIAITKIAKASESPPSPATHQLAFYTTLDGAGKLTGPHFQASPLNVPNIYGHPGAASAVAVGAYVYDWTGTTNTADYQPQIEDYTSPGPVTIYLDNSGNRLTNPVVRNKPEIAAVDGVGTTFFGSPYLNNQFSFFGTSCAAPHIAGVAALIVQAGGGPGKVSATTITQVLQQSASPRDTDPLYASGFGQSTTSGLVGVAAQGEAYDGANFFAVAAFNVPSGQYMTSLTLDASNSDLLYNTKSPNYPPVLGNLFGIKASDIEIVPNKNKKGLPTLTLKFKPGTFTSDVQIFFRVKPETTATDSGGSSADSEGNNVKFIATFGGLTKDTITGTIVNHFGIGFQQPDGFGLPNTVTAISLLP